MEITITLEKMKGLSIAHKILMLVVFLLQFLQGN